MSAPDGGNGWTGLFAGLQGSFAVLKEVWGAFILPAVVGWWSWRRWSATRADDRAKESRTEQQRRDDVFNAKFERLDEQVKQHVAWLEARAERAERRGDDADARADAADRERFRLELRVERHKHALANARQQVWALQERGCQPGSPRSEFPPVEE